MCGVRHYTPGESLLCRSCRASAGDTVAAVMERLRAREARLQLFRRICAQCATASHAGPPGSDDVACFAWSCPVFYERTAATREASGTNTADLRSIVRDITGGAASFEW